MACLQRDRYKVASEFIYARLRSLWQMIVLTWIAYRIAYKVASVQVVVVLVMRMAVDPDLWPYWLLTVPPPFAVSVDEVGLGWGVEPDSTCIEIVRYVMGYNNVTVTDLSEGLDEQMTLGERPRE